MTKMVVEKPTCFWRSRLLVVEPHSMSMVPFWTRVMRLAEVTGIRLGVELGQLEFVP